MARQRGRPKKVECMTKPEQIHVRLSKAELETLDKLADRKGIGRSDMIRNLIIDEYFRTRW